jgi:hypothetical protein
VISEQTQQHGEIRPLPVILKKILCRFARYFDGSLQGFYLDEHQQLKLKVIEDAGKRHSLIIVSRNFYSEQAKIYPVENKSELNKLLKLEFNHEPLSRFYIWKQKDARSLVNIWKFEQSVPSAFITLPESLLIALGNEVEQIAEVKRNHDMFVSQHNGLVNSALANEMINSYQRFASSTGVSDSAPVRHIASGAFAEQLAQGFRRGALPMLPSFIQAPEKSSYIKIGKKVGIPFSIVFTFYLIGSSAYLAEKQYSLQQALQEQSQEVDEALRVQQEYESSVERYISLQAFLAEHNNSAQLWLIMIELFEHAQFTNIRIDNGRYALRGSAEQATDLLARISQFNNISEAKFDFPTRISRGRELFVIGFKITGEIEASDLVQAPQATMLELDNND